MNIEIERKFLLKNDSWKASATGFSQLRDGLLSGRKNNKIRVRTDAKKGLITVKGPTSGLSRAEYEYEIPLSDAEEMLLTLCDDKVCNKVRFLVPHSKHVWYVDVYEGVLAGITIAEIELAHENETFLCPDWIGPEVTDDPAYGKWAMLARYTATIDAANSNPSSTSNGLVKATWHTGNVLE